MFLTNGDRNWVVRAGDTIDRHYLASTPSRYRTMTSTTALETLHELATATRRRTFGQPAHRGAPPRRYRSQFPPETTSTARPGRGRCSRPHCGRRQEARRSASVGPPPGGAARHARVELAYQPDGARRGEPPAGDSGRLDRPRGRYRPPAQAAFGDRAVADGDSDRDRKRYCDGCAWCEDCDCDAGYALRRDCARPKGKPYPCLQVSGVETRAPRMLTVRVDLGRESRTEGSVSFPADCTL